SGALNLRRIRLQGLRRPRPIPLDFFELGDLRTVLFLPGCEFGNEILLIALLGVPEIGHRPLRFVQIPERVGLTNGLVIAEGLNRVCGEAIGASVSYGEHLRRGRVDSGVDSSGGDVGGDITARARHQGLCGCGLAGAQHSFRRSPQLLVVRLRLRWNWKAAALPFENRRILDALLPTFNLVPQLVPSFGKMDWITYVF